MTESALEIVKGIRPGDVLDGKYRIGKVLGSGGMGVVVAAQHVHLREPVAIKFLRPEALYSDEIVARFAREARASVKIRSEHVARVLDVGKLPSGAPYMVMEYLEGKDLARWIADRGQLAVEQAVELVLQACEALAEAHVLGIVHRDLKPANLFAIRGADGLPSVKVLDFGISKLTSVSASETGMKATTTHAVFGSPHYMSPEQITSSRDVDVRADIWSLGVILFELITGKLPFDATSLPAVYMLVETRPPPLLRSGRADAPAALEEVVAKCLEKDRTKRYSDVADLATALAPFGPKRCAASAEKIVRIIQAAKLCTYDTIPAAPSGSPSERPSADPTGLGLDPASANDAAVPPRSDVPETSAVASWGRSAIRTRGPMLPAAVFGGVVAVALGAAAFAFARRAEPTHTAAIAGATSTSAALPTAARGASEGAPPQATTTTGGMPASPASAVGEPFPSASSSAFPPKFSVNGGPKVPGNHLTGFTGSKPAAAPASRGPGGAPTTTNASSNPVGGRL